MTVKDKINHPVNWETQPVTHTFTQLQNVYLILLGPGQALGQVSRLCDLDSATKLLLLLQSSTQACLHPWARGLAMLQCHYLTTWVLWYHNPVPQAKQDEGSRLETESSGWGVHTASPVGHTTNDTIHPQCSQPCMPSFTGLWTDIMPKTKVS